MGPSRARGARAPEGETREQDEENRRRKGLSLNNMPPELLHGDKDHLKWLGVCKRRLQKHTDT